MAIPESWSGEAFNPVPDSENRIHGDEIARTYGFRGGLVPGVVVSSCLLHPAAVAWGRDWLERGRAHVVVSSPVYDGEAFRVEVERATPEVYQAGLIDERGARCATADVSLPAALPEPPQRRGDVELKTNWPRPRASRETFDQLRETGLRAMRGRWCEKAEITRYVRDPAAMAPIHRDPGFAHPAFILGLSNWLLGRNVKMDVWLHLETHSQHFRAIAPDTEVVVEAVVADLFEKKGHEFVDLDVAVFAEPDGAALAQVRLRAIYKLRTPAAP